MTDPKEFLYVNWVDGMKINKTHFIGDQQAAVYREAQGNTILLNDHNYGLLPLPALSEGIKLWLNADNQHNVTLRVMDCRMVTRGGHVIVLQQDTALSSVELQAEIPGLKTRLEASGGQKIFYYIVLAVDPYARVAVGQATRETPPRLPHIISQYSLHLMPVDETNPHSLGEYQVPVGRLIVEEQRVSLDEEYIPPVAAVNAHQSLLEVHAATELFLGKMERWSLQIVQKILQKKQDNDLAISVQKICENVLVYLAAQTPSLRPAFLHQPPVHLIGSVSGLARLIKNSLDIFLGTIKEELINYLTEWCGVSQGEVESSITELCNNNYHHLDIKTSVDRLEDFTRTMSLVFSSLAGLDYIGKKRETGIFVKEQAILPDADFQEKRRNSFLAE